MGLPLRIPIVPIDSPRMSRPKPDPQPLLPDRVRVLPPHFAWVDHRLRDRLDRLTLPEIGRRLDGGGLSFTTALSLCAFTKTDQVSLVEVISRHALTTREAEAFLATYRAAPDDVTRQTLRRDPPSPASPTREPPPWGPAPPAGPPSSISSKMPSTTSPMLTSPASLTPNGACSKPAAAGSGPSSTSGRRIPMNPRELQEIRDLARQGMAIRAIARKIGRDPKTVVTLGRVGGRPLWNPMFLEFAKFYGFSPWAAYYGDAPRKGKVERPFPWIE